MSEETSRGEEATGETKVDVSKLVAIIPPASEIIGKKREKSTIIEKRIRIRFDRSLDKPIARIPSSIAQLLSIKNGDAVEIVVAGRKKAVFTAEVFEAKPEEEAVYIYPGELEPQGVSDNSIATIRKVKRS